MLYGTGVYTAGLFSIQPPRLLGLTFIACGVVALMWFPQYGVVSAALSFGLLHIIFGTYILRETTADGGLMNEPVKPDDIDAVIHERVRLSIVAALAVSPELSFNELKAMLDVDRRQPERPFADARRGGLHRRRKEFSRPPPLHRHAADGERAKGVRAISGNIAANHRPGRPGCGRLLVSLAGKRLVFLFSSFAAQSSLQEKHHETPTLADSRRRQTVRRRALPVDQVFRVSAAEPDDDRGADARYVGHHGPR